MAEGFLESDLEASLPLLEAASDWLEPGQDLSDVGTLQRVAVFDDLPRVVNLRVNKGWLRKKQGMEGVPGSD